MRPFVCFSTFLSLFFAAASVAADQPEIIGNQDKRIIYTEGWFSFPFPTGRGGTLAVTRQNSDTATLKVNNVTRIAVTVFVEVPGQTVRISLDNQTHDIFPSINQQPAWTSDLLDPSVPHTIQVIKQNPRKDYTSLDSFLVTYPSPSTTGSSSTVPNQSTTSADTSSGADVSTPIPTPSAQTAAAQQTDVGPVLSGGKLAGVIIACIVVFGLIVGLLYRQRRMSKRKAASTEYWEWMSSRVQVPPSQPPPPVTPSERFDGAETRETV